MKKNTNILYFVLLVFTNIILNSISKKLLNSDEFIINSLIEQFSNDQIKNYLDKKEQWELLSYAILPLFVLIKITIIAR